MKYLSILLCSLILVACGGGDETPVAVIQSSVPRPVANAATVSGDSAVAIHMYQALYGQAASYASYNSYVSQMDGTAASQSAFAATLAGNFNNVSDAALALQVLNNLGVTEATVVGAGEYATLLAAAEQIFGAYPTMRGQVILNMTNLFGNLEGDPTYGAAAASYNNQATVNYSYSSNPASTDVNLAKSMFAELRTTLNAFANGSKTGLLDTQATRISDDIKANVAPEMNKVANNISALFKTTTAFEDARAYSASNTNGFTLDPNSGTLYRTVGSIQMAWDGYGTEDYCSTDYAKGVTNKVVCYQTVPDSSDRANSKMELVRVELTEIAPNQYSYAVSNGDWQLTLNQAGQIISRKVVLSTTVPAGNGTIGKAFSGATITDLNISGTLPPSGLNPLGAPATGVDTVAISVVRTALPAANNFHYALTGSISTTNLTDAEKFVSLSLDSGTYLDLNEFTSNPVAAKLIGTAQTASSKATGTLEMGSFMKDADGKGNIPTVVAFTGSINDTVQTLTGKLDVSVASYNLYHSTLPESTTNYARITFTFTGTVQAPDRPLLKLAVAASRTGLSTSTVTLNYSYGTISITGSGIVDHDASTMTLSNQDGIAMTITSGAASSVTQVTKSGAILATISNGTINYADGYTESLM